MALQVIGGRSHQAQELTVEQKKAYVQKWLMKEKLFVFLGFLSARWLCVNGCPPCAAIW